MKKLICILLVLVGNAVAQPATPWDVSPLNFQNSPLNFQNSPLNFQNSPLNFQNSPYNWQSPNGIYDNNGNRQGYVVPNGSGTYNYFDNQGNRKGYSR